MRYYRNYFKATFFILIIAILFINPGLGQSGKELYAQKCGRCHVAFQATNYAGDEWHGIVRSMKAQASLTNQEIDKLINYLVTESLGEKEKTQSNPPLHPGYLYTEYFQKAEQIKNFNIHYLALYISGWVKDNIYYFAEFEIERGGISGNNTFVKQAYIDYWFTPNIAIKIGVMLTPFNRFDEYHDPLFNCFITPLKLSREIGLSARKEVGIDLHGYFNLTKNSLLGFNLYAIKGLGRGTYLRNSR